MKPVGVTVLPPYTREQAIQDSPDLVWTRPAHVHRSNADVVAISDYRYEGRS